MYLKTYQLKASMSAITARRSVNQENSLTVIVILVVDHNKPSLGAFKIIIKGVSKFLTELTLGAWGRQATLAIK